jgi:malate/lactate dehydrogenase-like protein
MSGRGAYYVEMIAKHGLVAIHTAASSRLVAPPGGTRPVLGTNLIWLGPWFSPTLAFGAFLPPAESWLLWCDTNYEADSLRVRRSRYASNP